MNIKDNGQGGEKYIRYIPDFFTYYLMFKALEILFFVVAHVSTEMVKYLLSIMASLSLKSSENMNVYKEPKFF